MVNNRKTSPLDSWKKKFDNFSGLLQFEGRRKPEENTPSELIEIENQNYKSKKEWEFRISIFPTQENLNKASNALFPIFNQEENSDLVFKLLSLNEDKKNDLTKVGWDGPNISDFGPESDRDQRGKEFCVYMFYDINKKRYQRTPEQWKDLMLKCWKALLDAKVEGVGYALTPSGDKPIPVEYGINVPISYTSFKPFKQRHGILNEVNYNPNNHIDPLAGVKITSSDLRKYGIDSSLKHSEEKSNYQLGYLKSHLTKSEQMISDEINSIANEDKFEDSTDATFIKTIKLLQAEIESQLTEFNKSKLINFNSIEIYLTRLEEIQIPRQSDSKLNYFKVFGELQGELRHLQAKANKLDDDQKEAILKNSIEKCKVVIKDKQVFIDEINNIKKEYANQININPDFLPKTIRAEQLDRAIQNSPAPMQLIFRKLIHLNREKIGLAKLEKKNSPDYSELTVLKQILDDTKYLKKKSHFSLGIPKGTVLMRSVFDKNDNDDPDKIFNNLKEIAKERINVSTKPKGLFHLITSYDPRDEIIDCLYLCLKNSNKPIDLLTSPHYLKLKADWDAHRSKTNARTFRT